MTKSIGPIRSIMPMDNYFLQVDFISGSIVYLNMKSLLDNGRFCLLSKDELWKRAITDGYVVHWTDFIELTYDEVLNLVKKGC